MQNVSSTERINRTGIAMNGRAIDSLCVARVLRFLNPLMHLTDVAVNKRHEVKRPEQHWLE